MMKAPDSAIASASPEAVRLYHALLASVRTLGPFQEEIKKTSVHLVTKSAFAGVRFRRSHLVITLKAPVPITSPRVVTSEQVSRNRWHCDVKVAAEAEIDDSLRAWMRTAYELSA